MAAKSKKAAVNLGLGLALSDQTDDLLFKTKGLLQEDYYMTSIEAEIIRPTRTFWFRRLAKATKKETCVICFEDIDSDLMFYVDRCGHRFCFNCVKQHIEVKLLDGTIPNCPQHRCKSQLPIDRCVKLLTPKLLLMWKQRIKEDSTPLTERVYCPYPNCSYLMSETETETELFSFYGSGQRRCLKCGGSFCVYCKVPWHSTLSCTDYKKLHPDPQNEADVKLKSLANLEGWRQCGKCQHMVELSYGCNHISCRYLSLSRST